MTYKFYDTSALINNIDRLFDNTDDVICISSVTLEELEHLKATNRANANHVLNVLENHDNGYYSVLYKEKMARPIKKYGFEITNDLKIIACAIYIHNIVENFIFISDDIS